jgi:hypothetical protein
MDRQTSTATTSPWQLAGSDAQLQIGSLHANVDLLQPACGLHQLSWRDASLAGKLFGVTGAKESATPTILATDGIDKFVRGCDLVANYPQCESQPFTLHIYWRLAKAESQLVILDAIVSLQTSLLECFPKAILTTELPASEAWIVPGDGASPEKLAQQFNSFAPAGVLIRGAKNGWSYLEITHPDDSGEWRVTHSVTAKIERELGGEFQEKGVIRRLRVRGAILSAENDLETAAQIIQDFSTSPPPLTA